MPVSQMGGFAFLPLAAAVHGVLQAVKHVTAINNGLQALGLRDKVRDKLNSNIVGKALVGAADFAQNKLG